MRQNTNAQAQLPRELEGPTIATMGFQRTYYTVPWAMWADAGRLLWLHPDYTVKDHPGGTLQMRIELRDDGYHVWPPRGESYNPQQDHGYFGGTSQPFIPVAVLHA
jgi:hypothetical protein